ncbi:hypothetical protein JCM5350_000923 [Sporobolomyces pararoseus]
MSSVPPEIVPTSRIDHLSNLPDELLESIFRDAYDQVRPTAPLSKFLLPYYEKNLYRSIKFESVQDLYSFETVLRRSPDSGKLVNTVEFCNPDKGYIEPQKPWESGGGISLSTILPLLTSLTSLDLRSISFYLEEVTRSVTKMQAMQNLRTFYLDFPFRDGNLIPPFLELVANLPSLDDLHITNNDPSTSTSIVVKSSRQLPQITSLSLSGFSMQIEEVCELIKLCPSLSRFVLDSQLSLIPLAPALNLLPSTLRVLDVLSNTGPIFGWIDPLLPRFQSLRHIMLSAQCYTTKLYLSLFKLPNLVIIDLAHALWNLPLLRALVSSPNELPHLRQVNVEIKGWLQGDKIENNREGKETIQARGPSAIMNGWWLPPGDEIDLRDLEELIKLGSENSIKVGGGIQEVIQFVRNYFVEAQNRAVIVAYYLGFFEPLEGYQSLAAKYGCSFVGIDLESIGPNLEIVETELPDQNWFVLSLKNREVEEDEWDDDEWETEDEESDGNDMVA